MPSALSNGPGTVLKLKPAWHAKGVLTDSGFVRPTSRNLGSLLQLDDVLHLQPGQMMADFSDEFVVEATPVFINANSKRLRGKKIQSQYHLKIPNIGQQLQIKVLALLRYMHNGCVDNVEKDLMRPAAVSMQLSTRLQILRQLRLEKEAKGVGALWMDEPEEGEYYGAWESSLHKDNGERVQDNEPGAHCLCLIKAWET